jgi:hypothetical protein
MNKHFTNFTSALRVTVKQTLSAAAVAACLLPSLRAGAQFTQGNVVVLQAGDGSAAVSNTSAAVFLKEYNTTTAGQSAVSSVTIPATGAGRLTISGTAASEGYLTLSTDSTKLIFVGYDTAAGQAVTNSTSANINRVIDTIGALAVPGRVLATSVQYSSTNFRSAVRSNVENYWGSGGNTGTYYFGTTATPVAIQASPANTRMLSSFNGNLYFSTGSSTLGIYKISGLPTIATAATSIIATGTGSSPYAFAVNPSETVVYVADDRTNGNGGIQKWVYSGGAWGTTPAYTLLAGSTTAIGARGLAVDFSGTYATIYATTTDNKLIKIVDSNSTAALTVLATAPANTSFHSVMFAPKAACTAPSLATAVTNITCSGNGAVNLTVTGGSAVSSYSWTGPSSFTATTQNITGLTNAGTYNVTVTTAGGCTATASATVANNASFSASITPPASTVLCPNDSITLSATTGTGYTYVWKLGGNPIIGATNATYKAGAAGVYTVTVTNGTCSATTAAVTLTANTVPALSTSVTNISCSQNGAVTLTTTGGTTPFTYSWTGPSSFAAATQNITGLTNAGTYNVTVSTPGGCTATTSAVVTSSSTLTATITASGATTVCQGDSVTLNANTGTGYTYQWKQGTNIISGATNATYKAGATGSYTVTITNGGCNAASNAIAVTVNPLPVAVFTPGNTDVCQGNTVVLHATTAPGNTYQWYLGANPISGATDSTYTTGTGGSYTLKVTKNGCAATSTPAVITTHALPDTTITVVGTTTFCDGDSVKLKATSAGAVYQWFKNGQLIAGATDSIYTAISGGDYKVAITNAFACGDTSVSTTVTVNPLPVPVITNTNDTLSTGTFTTYQWYLNGVAISGATSQTYVPTANGDYTVFVTDGNTCGDTADVITLSHVGITEPGNIAVGIYPNPVYDVLVIDAAVAVNVTVKDMQGRTVQQVSNAQRISIGNLPDGMYFLTIAENKTGRIIRTEKISKQSK